jgi:hypothetical protein
MIERVQFAFLPTKSAFITFSSESIGLSRAERPRNCIFVNNSRSGLLGLTYTLAGFR